MASLKFCPQSLERVLKEKLKSEPIMDLKGLVEYLNVSIGHAERECVKILYLNKRRQLIGEESYIGEMEKAPVYIKEITRKALIKNATSIIMSQHTLAGTQRISQVYVSSISIHDTALDPDGARDILPYRCHLFCLPPDRKRRPPRHKKFRDSIPSLSLYPILSIPLALLRSLPCVA